MTVQPFDKKLVAARPESYPTSTEFTDSVMQKVQKNEIFSAAIRSMDEPKKENLFMKFKHLPIAAIIAIVAGVALLLTGTTYAVVKTIQEFNNVSVKESGMNEYGREELTVDFKDCPARADGATYELKAGADLSADDGAKALQARCEIENIKEWLDGNAYTDRTNFVSVYDAAKTIKAVQGGSIQFTEGSTDLPDTTKVLVNGETKDLSALQPGDTVYTYPGDEPFATTDLPPVVFKLSQSEKYYSLTIQSYIHARAACKGNGDYRCLQSNGMNQVTIIVSFGGATPTIDDTTTLKEVQGIVTAYSADSISLDTGKGKMVTVQTQGNIIEQFNQSKVYNVQINDPSYPKTTPEELKISLGDSVSIHFQQPADTNTETIPWSDVLSVSLLVERLPNDLERVRKY
jgi:hypothetical protein